MTVRGSCSLSQQGETGVRGPLAHVLQAQVQRTHLNINMQVLESPQNAEGYIHVHVETATLSQKAYFCNAVMN